MLRHEPRLSVGKSEQHLPKAPKQEGLQWDRYCQALSQFWGHNVMQIRETPCPSWALHSSTEEKSNQKHQ